MFVIFCPTSSVSVCVPQIRERVILVGALKRFKQKSHSPKPIKTHFFNQLIFINLYFDSH
ncbi:hypothetical protein HPHPP16_1056 [Helicobacter pylori Hp P-16]|nr:hypothetical protein HPHPP16_1056 [Helicobacter pylori Hp P-16]